MSNSMNGLHGLDLHFDYLMRVGEQQTQQCHCNKAKVTGIQTPMMFMSINRAFQPQVLVFR